MYHPTKRLEKVFSDIKEENGPVDILVNNAGVGVFDKAETISEDACRSND